MSAFKIKTVALIGSGTIGWQFASFFGAHGLAVSIYDKDEKVARIALRRARRGINFMIREGIVREVPARRGMELLQVRSQINRALDGPDYVQESVYEDIKLKRKVVSSIEEHVSNSTIIGSSSGGIPASKINSALRYPERFLVAHPKTPVYINRLIEIVPSKFTSSATVSTVYDFFKSLDKVAILLKKETPGFVANRLYFTWWREALNLVAQGIVSAADLDLLFCNDFEWMFVTGQGPLLQTHLHGGSRQAGGIEAALKYYNRVLPAMWKANAKWTKIPDEVIRKVSSEVKSLKAINKYPMSYLEKISDERFAKAYRNFSARDSTMFYA